MEFRGHQEYDIRKNRFKGRLKLSSQKIHFCLKMEIFWSHFESHRTFKFRYNAHLFDQKFRIVQVALWYEMWYTVQCIKFLAELWLEPLSFHRNFLSWSTQKGTDPDSNQGPLGPKSDVITTLPTIIDYRNCKQINILKSRLNLLDRSQYKQNLKLNIHVYLSGNYALSWFKLPT